MEPLDIGPHFDRIDTCISTNRRLCKFLDVPFGFGEPSITQASLMRLLLKAHRPDEFDQLCEDQRTLKPKVRYKEDQVRKFMTGDPAQRIIGLQILEIVPFSAADQAWIMGFDHQVDTEPSPVVPAKLRHLQEVERIGKKYVSRQVDSRTLANRLRQKSESIAVMEHGETDRLRGMIRWWNLNAQGLGRIEDGSIRSGSEIAESDKSVGPDAAVYIAIIAGEDLWAQGRVMHWLKNVLRSEPYARLPILARPATCAGLKVIKRFGFERIRQPSSRIYRLDRTVS